MMSLSGRRPIRMTRSWIRIREAGSRSTPGMNGVPSAAGSAGRPGEDVDEGSSAGLTCWSGCMANSLVQDSPGVSLVTRDLVKEALHDALYVPGDGEVGAVRALWAKL